MREKTFIIAEAGVNHNGSLELAKKLVDVAAEAGGKYCKNFFEQCDVGEGFQPSC